MKFKIFYKNILSGFESFVMIFAIYETELVLLMIRREQRISIKMLEESSQTYNKFKFYRNNIMYCLTLKHEYRSERSEIEEVVLG